MKEEDVQITMQGMDEVSGVTFCRFKEGFDSIPRPTLWNFLKLYGMPIKIVSLINYTGQQKITFFKTH